jgi:hypothetical protein
MQFARPANAVHPRRFGRRAVYRPAELRATDAIADDLKLFATTFAAGFVFVTVLLA